MNGRVFVISAAGFLIVALFALAGMMMPSRPLTAGGLTPTVPAFLPVILKPLPTPTPTVTHTPPAPTNTPFMPSSTPPSPPTVTITPGPPPGICIICTYNAYNCPDFNTQAEAQACFNYCWAQVGYDVHRLDGDDDGIACEALPRIEWVP